MTGEPRVPELDYKLESFMLALWDVAGEEGTKNFGLHLHPRAARALENVYPGNRIQRKNGHRVIQTAMGDVIIHEDR